MRKARIRVSADSSDADAEDEVTNNTPSTTAENLTVGSEDERDSSLEPITSSRAISPSAGPRTSRRSRYSMNYQSYEATRIQPAEQTRRMLDYMFPGYQKRDPRNWYEKATQTNLNREEVGGLIGTELIEIEPIETEEKPVAGRISRVTIDDDDDESSKIVKSLKPHARSSIIAKVWDGPPIKVIGKASEEGFRIDVHDLQHEPQAITVPREVFDQKTLRLDVVPDEQGVPKIVVYVGDPERQSDATVDSTYYIPEASTVMVFDNKDDFQSRSISTASGSHSEPEVEEKEPEREPTPPPPPPAPESSSDDVLFSYPPARSSVNVPHPESKTRIQIVYDLDDEPAQMESEPVLNSEAVNSRLLEPVYSAGDKDDVAVDYMEASLSTTSPEKIDSDQSLSKEVSDWLGAEIFPKAMTPRKSESPRKKSETPELKDPTPEPREVTPEPEDPTPETLPVPHPEPERNLSKEVSDWLGDNILDKAKKRSAADKKKPEQVIAIPEPVPEPSFTKAGSHASDPGDRLFAPLENYPNNMAEDDLTSKIIPDVPLLTPSQVYEEDKPLRALGDYPPQYSSSHSSPSPSRGVSESSKSPSPKAVDIGEDEPLRALEDYPPQYSSSHSSPLMSRKASESPKSPSPKAVEIAPKKPEPESKDGSHSGSPRDRLFSPLEDHPSDHHDEHDSPRTTQSKTPSPKPTFSPVAIAIEDKKRDSTPSLDQRSQSKSSSPERLVQPEPSDRREPSPTKSIMKPLDGSLHSTESPRHLQIQVKSISPTHESEPAFHGIPIKKDDKMGPDEHEVSEWLDEEILRPAATEIWVDDNILKKAKANANVKKGTVMPSVEPAIYRMLNAEPKTDSSKRRSSADPKVTSGEEKEVEDWMENEVLVPAQVDNWVENKVLKPAYIRRPSQRITNTSANISHFDDEVDSWVSKEVTEPAASSSFIHSNVLQPAEVSVAIDDQILHPAEVSVSIEEQILGPASSRALEPSPPASIKSMSQKSGRSLRFDAPVITGEEDKPALTVKCPPVLVQSKVEKEPDYDSLSWVESSRNLSPFNPHPDHPGDGPKSLREDAHAKPTNMPPPIHGQRPQFSTSGYPYSSVPPTIYGIPQQGQATTNQPFPGPTTESPSSPMHQLAHFVPTSSPAFIQPTTSLAEKSSPQLEPATPQGLPSHEVFSPAVVPPSLELKETASPPPCTSELQIGVVPSWGVHPPTSDQRDSQVGPDKEQKRASILKNAHQNIAEISAPRKTSTASKTETRTSLIEKSKIQLDNYLTRDDEVDYKKPHPKLSKRRRSSSESDVYRRQSGEFLNAKEQHLHSGKGGSPSFFSRLCSPFKKSKSPSRSNKRSTSSSYSTDSGSFNYEPPPIPTGVVKKPAPDLEMKPAPNLEMKPAPKSSEGHEVNDKKLSPPKYVIPEPIKEESSEEKTLPQQPDITRAGQATPVAPPVYEQPGQGLPVPDQSGESPTYGQPPHYTTSPMFWQQPQGFSSNVQVGKPFPLPCQAPTPLETGYAEDIYTSTHPKFSDYEEAAKRRIKPEGRAESPKIPHPPKKGFPTFPDYEELTKPQDKLAAKDHSWYDAEGKPSPSPYASNISEGPHQVDASTSKASDARKEEIIDSPVKYVPPRPLPPGNGIPMFLDYHNVPAGEFPMFRDSPKMTSSHRLTGNSRPDEPVLTGSNYGQLPVRNLPNPSRPLLTPTVSPSDFQPQASPQATGQRNVTNLQDSSTRPPELYSQRPWEIPTSRPQGFPMQQPSRAPKISKHTYSQPDKPLSELMKPNLPVSRPQLNSYPEKQQVPHIPETGSYDLAEQTNPSFQKPELYTPHQQAHDQTYDPMKNQGFPPQQPSSVPKITRHSYSQPDRPLSEITKPDSPVPQQVSNMYPERQQQLQRQKKAQHVPEPSSYNLLLQGVPTFQNPGLLQQQWQQPGTPEQTYGPTQYQTSYPGQQTTAMQKPGVYAPGQPSIRSPMYTTPQHLKPWEIPSSRPYMPTDHLTLSMHRPGDYDQRQMFHPERPPEQARSLPSALPYSTSLTQPGKPYSASPWQTRLGHGTLTGVPPGMPIIRSPVYSNQEQTFGQTPGAVATDQKLPPYSASPLQTKQGPGMTTSLPSSGMPSTGSPAFSKEQALGQQKQPLGAFGANQKLPPYSASLEQAPPPPTFSKHYYSQPDRPLSELLQPRSPNQQQGSPLPNFHGERTGGSRKDNSPLPPGSGIPKFGDYDEVVQSSPPQISGDHDPTQGKRKIVTAAEKKAQIEKEMMPITEQMEKLKKQMYLLTSQKGPPIRTGPHSAHTRLPTSLELYSELERRTLDATKKEREEFRDEQRKKVYEEIAHRRIRREIERSKTIK